MSEQIRQQIILDVQLNTNGSGEEVDGLKKKLGDLNDTPADKSIKSLKQQLKEAKVAALELQAAGKIDTKEYQNAVKTIANLKDEQELLNRTVQAFNPDNKFQAVVSIAQGATLAVQGFAGAMAFVGVESETAAATIARLQGLMAFSDALNSVGDLKDGFKNFGAVIQSTTVFQKLNAAANAATAGSMKVLGIAANTTSLSFKALKAAIISTGIGALVIAIAALLPMITNWISGTDKAEAAQNRLKNAVDALNQSFNDSINAIDFATKKQEFLLRKSGATEAEIRGNRIKGLNEEYKALNDHYNNLNNEYERAVKDKSITADKLADLDKQVRDASVASTKKYQEIQLAGYQNDAENAEEGRKKQKEIGDKALADAKARSEKAAAKLKDDKEQFQKYLEEINKLGDDVAKENALAKLDERQKELLSIDFDFDEQIQNLNTGYKKQIDMLQGHLKTGEISLVDFNKKVVDLNKADEKARKELADKKGASTAEVEKKYAKIIGDFLSEYQKSEYQRRRDDMIAQFDEMIQLAGNNQEKVAELTKQKEKAIVRIDTEETNRVNTINAETNLVTTQTENVINEDDDADTKIAKLENVYNKEREFKAKKFQEELTKLGEDKAAIANLTAKYDQEELAAKQALADAKKKIDEEETAVKLKQMDEINTATSNLIALVGKQTVAGKALAVAKTIMNTWQGASEVLKSESVLPEPAATIAKGINFAATVATGFKAVKSILAVQVPGHGGGGANASTTAPSITAPQINSTVLNAGNTPQDVRVVNQQEQVVKAYISQRDLNSNEEKTDFLNKLGSI